MTNKFALGLLAGDKNKAIEDSHNGKTNLHTQAEINVLDPQQLGEGVLQKTDGTKLLSSGFDFTKFQGKVMLPDAKPSNLIEITPPSPYSGIGDGAITHSEIEVSKTNFAGYKYWMAFTPLNDGDIRLENPCVVASNNLVDWVDLGSNPIVEAPVNPTAYNADTSLAFNVNESRLYVIYRERNGGTNFLKITDSTDGINWTVPKSIASGTTVGNRDFATPSLWFDTDLNKWVCIIHNLDLRLPEIPVEKMISDTTDIYGTWSSPVALNITNSAGRLFWHSHFVKLDSGKVIGILTENDTGSAGVVGDIHLFSSSNLSDFIREPIEFSALSYRPSMVPYMDNVQRILLNTLSDPFFSLIDLDNLDTIDNNTALQDKQVAGTRASLVRDSFIRADNASSVGDSESGIVWSLVTGTVGILGNAAYNPTASTGMRTVYTDHPNARVSMKVDRVGAGGTYILFRMANNTSYLRCGFSNTSTTALIVQRFDGATTLVHSVDVNVDFSNTVYLDVECEDDSISIYLNKQCVAKIKNTYNQLEGGYGFRVAGAPSALIDHFLVTNIR